MKFIIAGASIAGLFTEYLLAKERVEVEVYEKERVFSVSRFLPEEAIINKVEYLELFSKSKSARLLLKNPDLVIERGHLVKFLAHFAQEAGVKIVLRHLCEGFSQFGKKVLVHLRNLETDERMRTSTDTLVGADGVRSSINLAASHNGHIFTALLQARVQLPED